MRQSRIFEMEQYVMQRRVVSLNDLAEKFGVSMNTIRRDVTQLLSSGRIRKVYGGVSVVNEKAPTSIEDRSLRNSSGKNAIGLSAASLVPDHSTVYLDSGTTTPYIIPELAKKNRITVITNNLYALIKASAYESLNVISLGGVYNHSTGSCVGGATLDALLGMRMNYCFMAATGITVENGVTNSTFAEVELKRSISQNNACIVLMADHTKFGHTALMKFCDISDLKAIVTDKTPSKEYLDYCDRVHVKILVASKEQGVT